MIDLGKRNTNNLYKIKLEDGTILKIKKPSQKLLSDILEFSNNASTGLEVVSDIFDLVCTIMNRNENNLVFKQEDLEDMLDLDLAMYIIQDYLNETLKLLGK